jgi:hypothetical protein
MQCDAFLWTRDTRDGRYVMAVYEELDQATILPVTAYEVREPH